MLLEKMGALICHPVETHRELLLALSTLDLVLWLPLFIDGCLMDFLFDLAPMEHRYLFVTLAI
jgi:hypothetical protein